VTCISEANLDNELYNSTTRQELQHEVIEGIKEKTPVRGHLWWRFVVCAEILLANFKIMWSQSVFQRGLQFMHDFLSTSYLFYLLHIFTVLSLAITLDNINKLLE